jgi:glutathione synthase/RimK-type ligase-like ATP-grasp enzyme
MSLDGRTILGITREPDFSPGKKEAVILRLTFDWLAARGVGTRQAPGEDPDAWGEGEGGEGAPPAMVLSMARGAEALDRLARWEEEGVPVVNTAQSVRDCSGREALLARLEAAPFEGFGIPRFFSCAAAGVGAAAEAEEATESWGLPVWAKGEDLHAREAEDILKVNAAEGLVPALAMFAERGVGRVLFQEHIEGEAIRFCGVGRERFWFWRSVATRRHLPYADALAALGRDASARLGLEIYGGDAVVTPEGEIFLIGLNDWPSFTGCHADASDAIAELACERLGIPG